VARKKKRRKWLDAKVTPEVLQDKDGTRYSVALVPKAEADEWVQDQKHLGLAQRMWARIRPVFKGRTSDADDETTTDVGGSSSMYGSSQVAESYYEQMKLEQKRAAMYDDYRRMYKECVLARRALNVTVDNVFVAKEGDEKTWEVKSDDSSVQNVLEGLDKRVEMEDWLPKYVRATLKNGDGMHERVADQAASIVRLKWLDPKYVKRNEDKYGRLDSQRAFTMQDETGQVYAEFMYWQVGHTRFDHEIENRYGSSFFVTARRPWRQIEMMKDGVIIRRLTRASKRYSYIVPFPAGTHPDEQKKIIEQMKDSVRRTKFVDSDGKLDIRKRPALDDEDIWLAQVGDNQVKVEMFDPGGMNDNLLDIKFFNDEIVVSLGVPPAHLGLDKEVRGRAHLGWVDINFARLLRAVQKMAAGVQRGVYDLQLALLGMKTVDKDQYRIVYPPISFVDEKLKLEVEQLKWEVASNARATLGIPTRWLLEKVVGLSEDEIETIMGDPDYRTVEPGASKGGGFGGFAPSPTDMRAARDAAYGNERIRAQLLDLRDKFQAVARYGLNQPAEF